MSSQNTISLLLILFIFQIIFVGVFIVIKKRWINKKPTIYSAQFTGQNVYLQFQNLQKKKSIEHVLNLKEEKKQDDDGDDIKRFLQIHRH